MIIRHSALFIRENWIDILLATVVMIVIFIITILYKPVEAFTNIEKRLCQTYVGKTDELEKVVNKFSRETCDQCSCCVWGKTKSGEEKCVAAHGKTPVFDSHQFISISHLGQKLK